MPSRLSLFGLTPGRFRPDIPLPGSPERSAARAAVEDADGAIWILERLVPGPTARRERLGRVLAALDRAGLPVAPYRRGIDGAYAVRSGRDVWRLAPFVAGDSLPRPDYVDHAERGAALAAFTADLRDASRAERAFDAEPRFDLESYIRRLLETVAARRPAVREALAPVLPVLAPLFEAWPDLPETLCQGDFHPLNVIWRGRSVAAVIDWEFAGMRPALYDAANCLSCVGVEDPPALTRGLAPALLRGLRDRDALEPQGFALLPETILGLRFAWLAEWLRRSDGEMIDLELRFMRLLADSHGTLSAAWRNISTK